MNTSPPEWMQLYAETRRELLTRGGTQMSNWGRQTCILWMRLVPWLAGWLRLRCQLHSHDCHDIAGRAFRTLLGHSRDLETWPVAFTYLMKTTRRLARRKAEREARTKHRETSLSALRREPVDPRSCALISEAEITDLIQSAARRLSGDQLAILRAEVRAIRECRRLDRKSLAKKLGICLRTLNSRLKALHAELRKLLSCLP